MILSELGLCSPLCVLIQDLGWTQLEFTSEIILIDVENSSFGYDSIFEKNDFRGVWPTCWRTFCFLNYVPWRRVLRTTCPWVEIQVSIIIRPHAPRQKNLTAPSRAQTTQRLPNHIFLPANAPANHTGFGIALRKKHNAVAALRITVFTPNCESDH